MTNHDFWMSISDIINEGFTSEGLAKLDDYAEQFSTGKILYKRFSPSEQYGCCQGGKIHVIASLLAGAEVGTDQLTAPEGRLQLSWNKWVLNLSILEIGPLQIRIFILATCMMRMFFFLLMDIFAL